MMQLKKYNLNFMFVNARSILSNLKLDELNIYANEHDVDVIGIAASWLTEAVLDSKVNLADFVLIVKMRQS